MSKSSFAFILRNINTYTCNNESTTEQFHNKVATENLLYFVVFLELYILNIFY